MSKALKGRFAKAYVSATPLTDKTDAAYTAALLLAASTGELKNITGDVAVDMSKNTSVVNTRDSASTGYESNSIGLKKGSAKFTMLFIETDVNVDLLHTAYDSDTEVFFASLSKDYSVAGARGPIGNYVVSDFTPGQPVDGDQTIAVTLLPSSMMGYYRKSST